MSTAVCEKYPDYQATIGIEVHVQLITQSKIFCSCPNIPQSKPNTNICVVCLGYPGVLPVLNKKVVDHAVLVGLATNSTISMMSRFDRKHYVYPDLPKSYQITQQCIPICTEGFVTIRLEDGSLKNIRIKRIHMEEDAGKNIHAGESGESFVDFNRAGVPLLEIVTYPDISNAYEARAYLKALHAIVRYLNVCTGNMQDGAFRADTNISVRKKGETELGTKCELKNINSFKYIGDATEYEIKRQIELLEEGKSVRQETRLWDTKNRCTVTMRVKEEAADYRFMPDPDLPVIDITQSWIESARKQLPELPQEKCDRLMAQYGLSLYEADIVVEDPNVAHYFERVHAIYPSKQVINWVLRDVMGLLKEAKTDILNCKVSPEHLAEIVQMIESDVINNRAAQEVFIIVAQSGAHPRDVVKEHNLQQMGSVQELQGFVDQIIANNPDVVAQYKAGNERLIGFFVGQAMKLSGGKANPKIIQDLFKKGLQ